MTVLLFNPIQLQRSNLDNQTLVIIIIITTIETIKRVNNNKKSKNKEVSNLEQVSLEYDISRELFDKILRALVQTCSIKSNTVENRLCLSILQKPQE